MTWKITLTVLYRYFKVTLLSQIFTSTVSPVRESTSLLVVLVINIDAS